MSDKTNKEVHRGKQNNLEFLYDVFNFFVFWKEVFTMKKLQMASAETITFE